MAVRKEPKQHLDKGQINKLDPPAAGKPPRQIYDDKVSNLLVRIYATGETDWYHSRWFKPIGRGKQHRIGCCKEMGRAEAVREAERRNGLMAQGIDPDANDPRAEAASLTLGDLCEWFNSQLTKRGAAKAPSTLREYDKAFKAYLGPLAKRKAHEITRNELRELHAAVTKPGKTGKPRTRAANNLIVVLKAVYNAAIAHEKLPGPNPANGITLHQEKKHTRRLEDDERERFLTAIEREPAEVIRDFALLLYFTGARKSNVREMRWDALDLKRGVWTVPDLESKNREAMVLALVPEAVEVLERRHKKRAGSPFVLPGRGNEGLLVEPEDGWKPLRSPEKGWKRILAAAGITSFRIHDTRHSLGSDLADLGVGTAMLKKALGHRADASALRYAHASTDAAREAMVQARPRRGKPDVTPAS